MESNSQAWKGISQNWGYITPPWRPSAEDLLIYDEFCPKKNGQILVLGSTPEIRDFVSKRTDSKPIIADFSREMLDGMSLFLRIASPKRENLILSDWISLNLPENYFDLIIGDLIWWVTPSEKQPVLRNKIAYLLKNEGIFVSRFRIKNSSKETDTLIKEYCLKAAAVPQKEKEIGNQLISELYDSTLHSGNQIDHAKAKNIILEASKNYVEYQDFLVNTSKRILKIELLNQPRKEIVDVLNKKFFISKEKKTCFPNYSIMGLKKPE